MCSELERRFVRIKETLYTYRDGKIKVSIKPYEEYLGLRFSNIISYSSS
jgi:hypothetical protein